jgi:hypothetical protein
MIEQSISTRGWRRRFSLGVAGLVLVMAAATAPAAASTEGQALAGQQLKSFISGKRIYLAVPFGGEIPLNYRANGVVDGTGEAAGLGKYMTPSDQGRWWVSGTKLCQQWQQWYKGRTFCFTVAKLSSNRIRWVRDDGKSGVARVR